MRDKKYINCPFFVSEKRNTISCENHIRYITSKDKKKEWLDSKCKGDWKTCSYAKELQQVYSDIEGMELEEQTANLFKFYFEQSKKTVQYLLSQLGILQKQNCKLEKKIELKNDIAESNCKTFADERAKLTKQLLARKNNIKQLETAIGFLLYEQGLKSFNLCNYKAFIKKYEVEFVTENENEVKVIVTEANHES